jgi:hypothetical protein
MPADLTADLTGEQVPGSEPSPYRIGRAERNSTYPEPVPQMQRGMPCRSQQ